jgi:hypothetical protein
MFNEAIKAANKGCHQPSHAPPAPQIVNANAKRDLTNLSVSSVDKQPRRITTSSSINVAASSTTVARHTATL